MPCATALELVSDRVQSLESQLSAERTRRSQLDNWLGMREILRTLQVEVSDFVSAVSTPIAGLEAHLKPISDIIRYIEARGYSI